MDLACEDLAADEDPVAFALDRAVAFLDHFLDLIAAFLDRLSDPFLGPASLAEAEVDF